MKTVHLLRHLDADKESYVSFCALDSADGEFFINMRRDAADVNCPTCLRAYHAVRSAELLQSENEDEQSKNLSGARGTISHLVGMLHMNTGKHFTIRDRASDQSILPGQFIVRATEILTNPEIAAARQTIEDEKPVGTFYELILHTPIGAVSAGDV